MKLNVGCGRNTLAGWVNLDRQKLPGVDVVADLDYIAEGSELPLFSNSVGEFLLSHVIEHIAEPLALMQELWRIAEPNAVMHIRVPYGSSNDAYEDPTHVRQYFTQSFAYFAQPTYWRADYGYRGDWQPQTVTLSLSNERYGKVSKEQMMGEITGYRNVVLEMVCELRAVKPIRPQDRTKLFSPKVVIALVDDLGHFVREV